MINMSYVGLHLDEKFSKMLLDIYSEMTGLSVAFFIAGSGRAIYSDANWPKFCWEFSKIIGLEKCVRDYSMTEIKGPYQCYAGLWCYSQPVTVGGTEVGAFVVGYRRIRGREKESKKVLKQRLSEHNVDDENSKRLMELLEHVDAVHEDAFAVELLERLSFIKQYITIEHQRLINEQERAFALKQESVSLAHEFLLPIQSIIADSENLFNESKEESKLKDLAEDVLQEVMKLSFIAENIRESVLGEQDPPKHVFQSVPICPIIQDTVDLFQKEANKKGVVRQREIGKDTKSFYTGLRAALRQDPDVIAIGEMRDYETIRIALAAAETGVLVLSTLHTISIDKIIERLLSYAPSAAGGQLRFLLAESLQGIVHQELIPTLKGAQRVATEVMITTGAARNIIRRKGCFFLRSVIETGKKYGMITMVDSINELLAEKIISEDAAKSVLVNYT